MATEEATKYTVYKYTLGLLTYERERYRQADRRGERDKATERLRERRRERKKERERRRGTEKFHWSSGTDPYLIEVVWERNRVHN